MVGLVTLGAMILSAGCNEGGPRRNLLGRPWLTPSGVWTGHSENDRVQATMKLDDAGLFGNSLSLLHDNARVQVGPLTAQTDEGQLVRLQPARLAAPSSMQHTSLDLSQETVDKREVHTKIIPGEVTVIEVTGGERFSRLTLPIRIDGVELLAMDYGWVMKRPGRFARNRVMTDFVLAEGKTQAVLLGADLSWGFEVDPVGQIAVVALHRSAAVRFYVGVAPKGQWRQLLQSYRKVAHPAWNEPPEPMQKQRLAALAGRMLIDDWSSLPYAQVPELLERLRFLGCEELVVIRHNWQRHGYDVKLPDTWPPASEFGATADMAELSRYCRAGGMLFGLHENFFDLYPDAPSIENWAKAYQPTEYRPGKAAQPIKAWLNQETHQQAVRQTPGSALRAMQRNLEMASVIQPNTFFFDVTSYVDPEPCQTEAGLYIGPEQVLQAARDLYRQAADKVHGPALGEGCTEKFLGSVDGANCDLWDVNRWGNQVAPADWDFFPLMDWLAHDRVVFHGVGYPGRYDVPNQADLTEVQYDRPFLDDYNSTNVLFGHDPLYFLMSRGFSADPLKMARAYWLAVPLHEVIGLQPIEDVALVDGDLHRMHVRYANGAQVWVNRGQSPWQVEGQTLGRFGYLVRAGGIEQQLTLEAGQPFEVLRASDLLYVDFRGTRRNFDGIEADGAVLIRYLSGSIEVVPLDGNRQALRVDLEKLGVGKPGQTIVAERVDLDGTRSSVEVRGTTIEVAPQQAANPDSLTEMYKRPLHKVVVRIGG
jgi:hypothetical protein